MQNCCPECNSANVSTTIEGVDESTCISKCKDCKFTGPTTKFPVGEYTIPTPDLKGEVDKWCDEAQVSKTGYFHTNALEMCKGIIDSQLQPWKNENTKLKLLIEVMQKKLESKLIEQALYSIEVGCDTIIHSDEDEKGNQVEKGLLILSYQHTNHGDEEVDISNAGQGEL